MNDQEFALKVESIRTKLYKTALTYLGSESLVPDAADPVISSPFDKILQRLSCSQAHSLAQWGVIMTLLYRYR